MNGQMALFEAPKTERPFADVVGTADFSPCGEFRMSLTRCWGAGPCVAWLMFNGSKASADKQDMTILRTMQWSRRWGYGGEIVVNALPKMSPKPAGAIQWWRDGPFNGEMGQNLEAIEKAAATADLHIVAFGALATLARGAVAEAVNVFAGADVLDDFPAKATRWPLYCIGTTGAGWPIHPMARGRNRVPDDAKPQPWTWPKDQPWHD